MVSHTGSGAGGFRSPEPASLQLLLDSFVAVASERDPSAILEQAVDLARLSTRARFGAAALVEEGRVDLFVHRGLTRTQVEALPHLPEGRGMLGAVLEEKSPIRLARLQEDRRSVGFPLNHVPMSAFLGVPIMAQDELMGAMYLTKPPGEGAFGEEDELFMLALAMQAGVALDAARVLRDREQVNRELQEVNRLKSDFVSMTSHELLTPLTAILGFASMLRQKGEELPRHKAEEFVEQIDREAHRLQQLVEQLLEMGKIEAGAIDARPARIPLQVGLREILDDLGPAREDVVLICDDHLDAFADPDHLRQIIVNYLSNAVKHGRPPIELTAREGPEAMAEIRVRDHGPGVPEGFVARLFSNYSRAAEERAGAPRGFGLGLSIARTLAEAQGGRVWYEPHPSGGAMFCLALPQGSPTA